MRETKGVRTERLILEAAARCIARLGIDGATTRAIAQEAGVSNGLVPHYIPEQSELLMKVMEHIVLQLRPAIRQPLEKLSGIDKLLHSFRLNFELFRDQPHYYSCFAISYCYSGVNGDLARWNTGNHLTSVDRVFLYLGELCKERRLRRPEKGLRNLAKGCMDLLEGGLLFYFFTHHGQDFETYVKGHLLSQRCLIEGTLGRPKGPEASERKRKGR